MNKKLMERLVDRIQNLPYHQFIGMKIVSWGEGVSQISFSTSKNPLCKSFQQRLFRQPAS